MHATIAELIAAGPVLTDGAWGTQLQERGLPLGACPDAWNLTQPAKVEEVARAYVEAGSRVILTNTFGANRFILARHGLADQGGRNQPGRRGHLAPSGPGPAPRFSPRSGPRGVMLMMGQVKQEELQAAFAEQARAIAEAGADGIAIETMSDPAEAALAVAAARETGLPVVACMTFDSGAKKDRTMMGTTPEQAAEELAAAGADVIGSELRPGHRRLGRSLPPATGRHRPAGLDQSQRRPAGNRRWQDGLPTDAGRVRRLRARSFWRPVPRSSAAAAARRPSSSAQWRKSCNTQTAQPVEVDVKKKNLCEEQIIAVLSAADRCSGS